MNADALSNRFVHFTAIAMHFKTLTLLRFGALLFEAVLFAFAYFGGLLFLLFIFWIEGFVVVFVEVFVDVGEFVVDFVADLTE